MIILFWETLQCNKRFRSFVIDTDRAHDFIILVLFYALENKSDLARQGVVRMCVFLLQTLSAEPSFGKSLNKRFEGQGSLPVSIRIPGFHGTYADYLIMVSETLAHRRTKTDKLSPSLPSLRPAKGDCRPSTPLYLLSSTTLPPTSRTSAHRPVPNYCNCFHPCPLRRFSLQMIPIMHYFQLYWSL